jgi:hypothetical protein
MHNKLSAQTLVNLSEVQILFHDVNASGEAADAG